jgi:hypothetical protein
MRRLRDWIVLAAALAITAVVVKAVTGTTSGTLCYVTGWTRFVAFWTFLLLAGFALVRRLDRHRRGSHPG